jgi:WhiB family transcriptional regulator, redox-sensing transcriptional regulator
VTAPKTSEFPACDSPIAAGAALRSPRGAEAPPGPVAVPLAADTAGISYRQLDFWARQGYLRPCGTGGSGNGRLWTAEEVAVARRMGDLVTAGLTAGAAAQIAREGWPGGLAPGSSLHPAMRAGDWQDLARCRDVGTYLFFPEKGEPSRPAKRICRMCEVREPCLEYALAEDRQHGIYAGLSPRERQRIKDARLRGGAA